MMETGNYQVLGHGDLDCYLQCFTVLVILTPFSYPTKINNSRVGRAVKIMENLG